MILFKHNCKCCPLYFLNIQLFLTFTDCNIDYTSPLIFHRAVRAVGRIGEMDMSCNIVSGSPSQSCKIALADFSFYLSNRRFSHTNENSQLLYSNQVKFGMSNGNLSRQFVDERTYCAFEDVLGSMGFVSLLSLDSADMLVIKLADEKSHRNRRKGSSMPPAKLTLDLTLGQLNLYACRDSFTCLTDLISDVSLHFAKLSEEERPKARPSQPTVDAATGVLSKQSMNKPGDIAGGLPLQKSTLISDAKTCPDEVSGKSHAPHSKTEVENDNSEMLSNIPDSELSAKQLRQKHNIIDDDDVAMRLARALLIKNYYTVDTKPLAKVNQCIREQTESSKNMEGGTLTADEIIVAVQDGLLLDGYDWTEVDYCGWSRIPSESVQKTEWFPSTEIQIFPNHISIDPVRDPLAEGNMNSAQLAGIKESPSVELRIFLRDLSANCRFFTGMDWEEKHLKKFSNPSTKPINGSIKRKEQLLGTLLEGLDSDEKDLFSDRSHSSGVTQVTRQLNSYFELAVSSVRMRVDAYSQSVDHRLLSTLDLSVMDFFLSESISSDVPTKLLFEWLNVEKHPRDANDGMLMMKVSFL
jgi:hypothetical protein